MWFASKVNVSAQDIAAATNAIVSIVGTSITLISQAPNHGCQDNSNGLKAECALSTVTIAIGTHLATTCQVTVLSDSRNAVGQLRFIYYCIHSSAHSISSISSTFC